MSWTRPRSIRLSLTVWYVGAMVVVLGVYAACLLIFVNQGARSEAGMRRTLRDLMITLVLSLPLAVAAAGVGGYSLARRALVPVDRIVERAHSITADRLSERLPVANPDDELGRLASVFN